MQDDRLQRQKGEGEPTVEEASGSPEGGIGVGGFGGGESVGLEPEDPAGVQSDGKREAAGPFAGEGEHPAGQHQAEPAGDQGLDIGEAPQHLAEGDDAGEGVDGFGSGWTFEEVDPRIEGAGEGGDGEEAEGTSQHSEDDTAEQHFLKGGDQGGGDGSGTDAAEPAEGIGGRFPEAPAAEQGEDGDETEGEESEEETAQQHGFPGAQPTDLVSGPDLEGADEWPEAGEGEDEEAAVDGNDGRVGRRVWRRRVGRRREPGRRARAREPTTRRHRRRRAGRGTADAGQPWTWRQG